MSTGDFDGKVVLVTGAAGGIGAAAAEIFASRGARVVAADRNVEGAAATVATIRAGGRHRDRAGGRRRRRCVGRRADRGDGRDLRATRLRLQQRGDQPECERPSTR